MVSSRSISTERSLSCRRTRAPPIPAMAVSPSPRCPPPPPTLPEEATLRRLPNLVVSLCTADSAHQQCLSVNSCIKLIKCKVVLKCSLHNRLIDHTIISSMKNCHLQHFSNRSISINTKNWHIFVCPLKSNDYCILSDFSVNFGHGIFKY